MSTTGDIVAFLNARYDETAGAATEAQAVFPGPYEVSDRGATARVVAAAPTFRDVVTLEQWPGEPPGSWLGDYLRHFTFHDPASVLADIDAKRRLIWGITTDVAHLDAAAEDVIHRNDDIAGMLLRDLAAPFSAHPDFDPAWTVADA